MSVVVWTKCADRTRRMASHGRTYTPAILAYIAPRDISAVYESRRRYREDVEGFQRVLSMGMEWLLRREFKVEAIKMTSLICQKSGEGLEN